MIHNKFRYLMTLVALLAVTTGAWADETPLVTIVNSGDNTTFTNGSKTFDDKVTVTFSGSVDNDGDETGWYSYTARTLTVTAAEGYTITSCKFYTFDGTAANGYTVEGESPSVCLSAWQVLTDDKSVTIGEPGVTKIEVYGGVASSASAVEVAWDKTAKTGTFTMPAGNVLVDVEYKDLTEMALTFGGKAIPEAGVKGFLGFEQEFIDGLNLDAAVTNTDQNGAAVTTDATSYTYTSSDATVIGFKTATEGVYAQSGALADMEFRQEGSATLTIQYAGTEDLGKSAETVLLVTVTEKTYTVELADNTADADNWQGKIGDNGTYAALPVEGLKGSEKVVLKYDGSRIVKRVTATVEGAAPAGPKTYTELKGGEVLKPGDILSDANLKYLFDDFNLMPQNCPFTVIRANITGDEEYPTVTPADDGAYYVIQDKNGDYYFIYKNLPATATSDGILITINSENGNYRFCSVSVHEP